MKIRKELWFGFVLMAIIIAGTAFVLLSAEQVTRGHLGLMMLALVVVAIMLGFPTAFTLMGMGMLFTWLAYDFDTGKTLTLMVQSAFKVMGNDVLISIPLFVFMGYLVERANLIEKLFKSLHLAMARVPGSLAVATIFTCAVFATATGIVGAVVTLMGLLALPQMLKGGYDVRVSAGAITAGGCLGILIPPSVMLIVYGATAGVSVVQLYAGAFFPGLMLAALYVLYVVLLAKLKPALMPPLSAEARFVPLPPLAERLSSGRSRAALPALLGALGREPSKGPVLRQLGVALLPVALALFIAGVAWLHAHNPLPAQAPAETMQAIGSEAPSPSEGGLAEPPADTGGLAEPPADADALAEPPAEASSEPDTLAAPPATDAAAGVAEPASAAAPVASAPAAPDTGRGWIGWVVVAAVLAGFYAVLNFQRLEIFKLLLTSFFPLLVMILAVLGSIVFGLATPTEAAAVGAFGGYVLAAIYSVINKRAPGERRPVFLVWLLLWMPLLGCLGWYVAYKEGMTGDPVSPALGAIAGGGVLLWALMAYRQARLQTEVKESVFLTAKTSAMVCWLFVGSAIFSAAFALLGGQELVEKWVLGMKLSKVEFLVLSQLIIFILGWPLEWTEIIVIFMPIFIPLLDHFGVDPLFFGLLVALNLQTAFLSPPVAMAAFYLKGVAPPHVTLNQIFAGMLPFMAIQVIAIVLLYLWPEIGLWLPKVLYG
ncbi:TRAP transporter large permease subunit [Roseateles asaccharophilus]|uniref:TRAP-type mannitol/chloroaromatic compound transport system permease large subunit n=1 Tax=Roseateles asaccharophilus TaxID=582607 RepID=A0ABU2A7J4_9BURK|nr:TRAP transporter large permease subunit [Roseateles asaccharophilus]MDR7333173.1 TRAP-type mannitol/chloroaromatic compound transport system permease large subunit [Roseateles asaccharophilus]